MSADTPPLAVVGAGIGGLAASLFLSRAGFPVTLIERRIRVEAEGAGLQLSPNASRVLIDAGLGSALRRRATAPERIRIRRATDGRELATIPLGSYAMERYGAPYLVIHRADLASLLLDALRGEERIRLLYGREALEASASLGADGVALALRNERAANQLFQAAAVIAADGLWGRLAAAGDPPRFSGFAAWRALVPATSAPHFARANEVGLWLGPDAHLVHYPLRDGEAVNIVAVIKERIPQEGWSRQGEAGILHAAFARWNAAARDLIACVPDWRGWSLFDREPLRRWGSGRTILLGDAAHPMLPFLAQGAAMAIEDAAVLARELAPLANSNASPINASSLTPAPAQARGESGAASEDHATRGETGAPSPIAAALRRYERARRDRTARVQREARRNAFAYHAAWPFAVARDLILSGSSSEKILARYDWLYAWRAG
jgi:salicylate hydroxylase